MNSWEYDHFNRAIERMIGLLIEIKKQGETTMAQIDDLNTAIQAEDVELSDLSASITTINADITKLLAAVAAGATPTDLTNQITAIQAHTAALTTAVSQLASDDTSVNPPVTSSVKKS